MSSDPDPRDRDRQDPSDDPYVLAWDESDGARLARAASDDADWYADVAARLVRPTDTYALDVGCGGAGMAVALANALSATATTLGVDGSAEALAEARANLPTDRVRLERCDLSDGGTALKSVVEKPVDVVWSSAFVHHVGDQQRAIDELAALLAPGGRLATAEGGLPARHLPWDLGIGAPGLEVRFQAAQNRWFTSMRERLPGSTTMPYGWPEALRRSGLEGVTTFTTLMEKPTPLEGPDLEKTLERFEMYVEKYDQAGLLEPDDRATWRRLLDSGDDAWLGRRRDLFQLEARSVHVGSRPVA